MAHILLVDDDALVVETLSNAITNKGHTLVTATNGEEGIRKFGEGRFDLVITDIIMPEKEGIETIMEMRRLAPGTKIVAISGGGRTGNVDFLQMAEKLGATAALRKPIRLADFYEMLERCLADFDGRLRIRATGGLGMGKSRVKIAANRARSSERAVPSAGDDRTMADTQSKIAELDSEIADVKENLRELVEQAAGYSGAADEELTSQRIADQEALLDRLTKEREALAQAG